MEMFQKQMALRLCIKNFNNHQALKILNLYLTKYIGLIIICACKLDLLHQEKELLAKKIHMKEIKYL